MTYGKYIFYDKLKCLSSVASNVYLVKIEFLDIVQIDCLLLKYGKLIV